MKRCKTCKHYTEELDGEIRVCRNDALYQENFAEEHFFRAPSRDFGCTEHEEKEGE